MNQDHQILLVLALGTVLITGALVHHSRRGGAGDDHSTAAGRTYGAHPEPDDGGPELDRPLWRDHLTLDPELDEELPRGIGPRRPTRTEQEPE